MDTLFLYQYAWMCHINMDNYYSIKVCKLILHMVINVFVVVSTNSGTWNCFCSSLTNGIILTRVFINSKKSAVSNVMEFYQWFISQWCLCLRKVTFICYLVCMGGVDDKGLTSESQFTPPQLPSGVEVIVIIMIQVWQVQPKINHTYNNHLLSDFPL